MKLALIDRTYRDPCDPYKVRPAERKVSVRMEEEEAVGANASQLAQSARTRAVDRNFIVLSSL